MIENILKLHLQQEDKYIYVFADPTGLLDPKYGGFNYGISIGKRVDYIIIDPIINGPKKEYDSHFREIAANGLLGEIKVENEDFLTHGYTPNNVQNSEG